MQSSYLISVVDVLEKKIKTSSHAFARVLHITHQAKGRDETCGSAWLLVYLLGAVYK